MHTGDLSLEWSEDQLAAFHKVKADPVYIGKNLIKQSRSIRQISDCVMFFMQKAGKLGIQQIIIHHIHVCNLLWLSL